MSELEVTDGNQLAVTERSTRLDKFTEDDVSLALRLLVLVGGSTSNAVRGLADEGLVITHEQLRYWRDTAFPRRYADIRAELMQDSNERVAGDAMDRALKLGDAQDQYIEQAVEQLGDVPAERLAAAARDLARASAENVNQAQLLRNKPTQIVETRDTNELLDQLVRMGIVERDPRAPAPAIPARGFEQSATPKKEGPRRKREPSAVTESARDDDDAILDAMAGEV